MIIVQYIKPPVPDEYQTCMAQVEEFCIRNKISRILMYALPWEMEMTGDHRYDADEARIRLAAERPDMVWLDADCTIQTLWEPPDDGYPYFLNVLGNPDPAAFYVNGCTGFFNNLLKTYEKNDKLHKIGWIQYLLTHGLESKLIPENIIKHKGI